MDKRTEILNAAAGCFARYGYEKTSMSDIGRQVGMNKASLYYHFKSKEDLFSAMMRSQRSIHRSGQAKVLEETDPGIPRIVTFLIGEIDFIEALAVNFLEAPSKGAGKKDDTMPVYSEIIADDINILESLLHESPRNDLSVPFDQSATASIVLKIARALLLADCPLDGPQSGRGEGYKRVREDIKEIIPMILKGAGIS